MYPVNASTNLRSHQYLRTAWCLIAALVVFGLAGCDTGSDDVPVDLTFTGQLGFGEQQDHFYSLTGKTTIRFTIVEVERISDNPLPFTSLSIALGTPTGTECTNGFSFGGTDGSIELVAINAGDQCLTVFEPGLLGAEEMLNYTVRLTNL